MLKEYRKIIVVGAVIGTIGSLLGWYWDSFTACLGRDIHQVHFGVALLWVVVASLATRLLNRLIFKD